MIAEFHFDIEVRCLAPSVMSYAACVSFNTMSQISQQVYKRWVKTVTQMTGRSKLFWEVLNWFVDLVCLEFQIYCTF